MNIYVNNKEHEVTTDTSVTALLQALSVESKGVAVAVNNTVIPKTEWETHSLAAGDKVTLIKATQGG